MYIHFWKTESTSSHQGPAITGQESNLILISLCMNSVNDLLDVIKKKFPRQGHRIDQLYDKDSDFRSLCEDYLACLQSIEKYKKVSAEKQQSIKDFEGALNDLEKELYDFIFP